MPQPTYRIWSQITPALAHEILGTVQRGNKKLYRTALDLFAPRMGIRVPTLLEMPKAQRHAAWQELLARPELEVLGFNLLSAWLIAGETAMLCAWLDCLNIAHGANGCADAFPPEPPAAAQGAAIDALFARFDPVRIAIYLRCFNQIDETHWSALATLLETDERLALKLPAAV